MNNITNSQLLNISESATFLGTTPNWINFLKDNQLIIPVFLPQYKKPRFSKASLLSFISRLEKFTVNEEEDTILQQAFYKAEYLRKEKFEKLKNINS